MQRIFDRTFLASYIIPFEVVVGSSPFFARILVISIQCIKKQS